MNVIEQVKQAEQEAKEEVSKNPSWQQFLSVRRRDAERRRYLETKYQQQQAKLLKLLGAQHD